MKSLRQFLKYAVTSAGIFAGSSVCAENSSHLNDLFKDLSDAESQEAMRIEQDIVSEWSRSGSDAMDLLLERGRDALGRGDAPAAIGHLTALVDHAPEFAEGYNARATAYYIAGLYGPAIADIGEVLIREPRHFGALSGLALIYEQLGNEARARDVLMKIRSFHPQMEGLEARIHRLDLVLQGTAL